jgi:fucose 4-O-acetylase-like acetyltransferase
MNERITYIDLAKGFCIVLVIFFHSKAVLNCYYPIDTFLVSFRLPLYFFLSGLFFKDYSRFIIFLKKKTNRLMIPFFFFYVCFSVALPNILHYSFNMHFETVVGWPSLWAFIWPCKYPNIPIWFLLCLFMMNIIFWWIHEITRGLNEARSVMIIVLLCLLLGIIGYKYLYNNNNDYGNIFKSHQNMPFFCFGYLFSKYRGLYFFQTLSYRNIVLYFLVLFGITFYFTTFVSWPHFFSFFLCGITGTLMILLLARLFNYLPLFNYIGRYSIILLLTHGIIIRVITPLYHYMEQYLSASITTFILTILIVLSYYVIIPFMRRYLPYVTAQRSLLKE